MRAAGILMPISSLSSDYGIGTFGKKAYEFVDFLEMSGQKYWQILPLGPTGYGDSPYQSFSAFAISLYYVDLDILCSEGLLNSEEILSFDFGEDASKVDYFKLYKQRKPLLELATARFDQKNREFLKFKRENAFWLRDYALFMAIKADRDMVPYTEWEKDLKLRKSKALKMAKETYKSDIEFWEIVQFFAYSQWLKVKKYANSKKVEIIGDIPIYVSPDSSDIWASPELFQTDKNRQMTEVAGCPPDAFTEDGQLWGNPLYDWDYHVETGFSWWITRLKCATLLFDVVRIDHFRGFVGYYAIPFGAENAKIGRWRIGPAYSIIQAFKKNLPESKIIAEDLGFLTEDVIEMLKQSGFPGMKVLQFAFDSSGESDYLPHNYTKNSVVYTGTHDNSTTAEWEKLTPKSDVEFCREYMGIDKSQNITSAMIKTALASVADTCIIPIADWLDLGEEARINTPSTLGNNWVWRIDDKLLTKELAKTILRNTQIFGRL